MPQVPYQPFSTASPSTEGTRPVGLAVPPAAFGVNIGEALKGFGSTLEQSGDELFKRALALQDLKNQTDAQSVGIDHAVEAGKREADFKSLPDKERAESLGTYLQSQKELREQFRARLGNDMARHYFDADSGPFTRRIIFAASSIAGEAQKKYTVDTLQATVNNDTKASQDDPKDDLGFERRQARIKQNIRTLMQVEHGVDDPNHPIVKNAILYAQSKNVYSRAMGFLKDDPEKAMDTINQYQKFMTTDDYNKARDTIEYKNNAIISAHVTDEVLNKHLQPDGTYDRTTKELQDEAKQIMRERHPNNKLLPIAAAKLIDQQVGTDRYAKRIDNVDAMTSLNTLLSKYNPKNTQELLAIEGADMLVAKLPSNVKENLDAYIFRYRQKADVATRDETIRYLNGLKNGNVEQFTNIPDFTAYKGLSAGDVDKYQKDQLDLIRNPRDDTRVTKAMAMLKSYYPSAMQDLHLMKRETNAGQRQKDYDSFLGMLQEALTIHLQDTGKPASETDLKEKIGPQLIRHHSVRSWTHPIGEEVGPYRGFVMPKPEDVPQEFKEKLVGDTLTKGGTSPTDHQMYQAYLRMIYNKAIKEYESGEPGRK